jgi:hypothetical protein
MSEIIFKNQSSLKITLTTNVNITGALSRLIKYIKPDGSTGSWTATAGTLLTGEIYYDFIGTELNVIGTWIVWAYVTFADGRSAPGTPAEFEVRTEGDL